MVFLCISTPVQAGVEREADQWLAFTQRERNSYDALAPFINAHPTWPFMNKLRAQAEAAMPANLPDAQVLAWFQKNEVQTGTGAARYAAALMNSGRQSEAEKLIRTIWTEKNMSRDEQRNFFARFANQLDKASNIKRLDLTLFNGDYSNGRAVASALGGGYPALAEARIALAMDSGDVESKINALPAALRNDPGLLYERLKWRRENNLNDGAIEILAKAPPPDQINNPDGWWKERNIIIRRLMETRQYKRAYDLASRHGLEPGSSFTEAQWVSGFLALRFVNKPWEAFETFERMYHNVETPISKARAAYWAGRASEALKHAEIARQWYKVAAGYNTTFYGQMAASALGMPDKKLPAARSSDAARQSVQGKDMVRAAKYLSRAGYRSEAAAFLLRAADTATSAEEIEGYAAVASGIGQQHIAIKIAQEAQNKHGMVLTGLLYPTLESKMKNLRDTEWALAHAIIRQESRFDQYAVSPAGAQGLMQLMPGTAKETARKIGVSHQRDWLTSRPDHNIQLGTRYIHDMVNRYDGEYALAAAAYNAGPGRVSQWIRQFGDPRRSNIDFIDWIEEIPIYETRNYVQRVLEGVYVYRQLLGNQPVKGEPLVHLAYK